MIHPSSVLLCLAPDSTHGDLFLRHRQMGSSLESCSKLERGDCSFQERESCRSMRICSCFKNHGVGAPSLPLRYHIMMSVRDEMCGQLVSLGDNSDSGKHPVYTSSRAKFQIPHMTDPMMDWFPHSLLPASSSPLLTHQGIPEGTHQLFFKTESCSLAAFPNTSSWLV